MAENKGKGNSGNATGTAAAAASAASNKPPDPKEVLNVNIGILGHVDSGKTSLVKTLSTLLSTAALDKSNQSRQRGMTLDLGFSCFFLDMPDHLQAQHPDKTKLQITLVDCPGHASLIRTIIGGAQIIDMVLLVVDAYKGWQAQTTECLVLAELTSPHLIVALNKIDMFPPDEREAKVEQAKAAVERRLHHTRFANRTPMIGVSACVGGEKVAAATDDAAAPSSDVIVVGKNETYNVDRLVQLLHTTLPQPRRSLQKDAPFYFAIDHCFPIKGMGTVITGTVLNGQVKVNDMIEFPTLGLERKVKSMQMFKRKVKSIQQGDRAGVCVSSLDANLLERGVASAPGAVQLLKSAIALVKKIPYFPGRLAQSSKFHISVGHTTIMATVTFWGARELAQMQAQQTQSDSSNNNNNNKDNAGANVNTSLGGDADRAGLPFLKFDYSQDFRLQDEGLLETLQDADGIHNASSSGVSSSSDSAKSNGRREPLLHWAKIDFQIPVHCPLNSLIIGSRLDVTESRGSGKAASAKDKGSTSVGMAGSSTNAATIESASSCRLAFCGRLVERIHTDVSNSGGNNDTNNSSSQQQQIRLYTPKEKRGVIAKLGEPFKRADDGKIVRYEVFGTDLFKKETNMKPFIGMKFTTASGNDIGELTSSYGTTGKFRVHFPAGTEAHDGDALIMPFKRFASDPTKAMHQDLVLPTARPGSRLEVVKKTKKKPQQVGKVDKVKGDVLEANGKHSMAIIAGFFTPEINIRDKVGQRVFVPSTNEEGTVAGPFGKAGKCKVNFPKGISAEPGAKAELYATASS